jgi:3-oxoacyl-[acyl-carrier protein] reductase
MRFAGKIALVTGGSQGIGEAICRRLAAEGATVAVLASNSQAKAEAVAATLGHGARGYAADVSVRAQMQALMAQVSGDLGRIDILVNSAGIFLPTPAGEADEAVMDRMIDTNLKGTFLAIDAVVPLMKAQGGGAIINLASVAGVAGIATYAIYCATKAGVIMMTRSLAQELAPYGIRVNAVAPGNTETPMNEAIRTEAKNRPMLEAMAAKTPSRRTYSSPEDMAGMVAFLASDEARSMHGSTVLMDEGISAGI